MSLESKLEEYLSRGNVLLEMKISTLLQLGFRSADFVRLGEKLIEEANPEERERCEEKISNLSYRIEVRKMHLQSGG